ncbi:MAG: hypothetical protein RLN62_06665 [Rickettsiales bacterium]
MHLVQTHKEFSSIIKDLTKYKVIALDTEFLRDKTYYPEFCLLQIATENKAYAIDPLSSEIDISLLKGVLEDSGIVKVIHSCKQDVEILEKSVGTMPQNIFDTQIAAAFCGISDMISYEVLCNRILNVAIDKTQRITDWSMRPLRENQIKYAINDVIYLIEIYKKLLAKLDRESKKSWALEYMKNFSDPDFFKLDKDQVWQRLTMPQIPFKAKHLYKVIAVWREEKAMISNKPRRKFLSDRNMINISLYLSGVNKNTPDSEFFDEYHDEIRNFVEEFSKNNKDDYLTKRVMTIKQRGKYRVLKNLLTAKAKENNIARHLVAKNSDLTDLIFQNDIENNICMHGWRKRIYGNYAAEILDKK